MKNMETFDFDKVEFVHDIKQIDLLVEYLYNTKDADFDMGMALVYKRGLNFYVFGDNHRMNYHKVNRITLWLYFVCRVNKNKISFIKNSWLWSQMFYC